MEFFEDAAAGDHGGEGRGCGAEVEVADGAACIRAWAMPIDRERIPSGTRELGDLPLVMRVHKGGGER